MKFAKYQGLGNAYVIVEPAELGTREASLVAQRLSDVCLGVGSDGLLLGPLPSTTAAHRLRIFNPDGSEAEKSGNGLRIFARYLWDQGSVGGEPFTIETLGGIVRAQVLQGGELIDVHMGQARFASDVVGLTGAPRDAVDELIEVGGHALHFCAVSVGNPHCVIFGGPVDPESAKRLGPLIERDPRFVNRTNVQFARVVDRHTIAIEIWERGAGYTLASGSSSTAAASAAKRLGHCESPITVQMPGGSLRIEVQDDFETRMLGPARPIAFGEISPEALP